MNLLSDVRYCLRGFARRPLFAAVVVATLALGLSINALAVVAAAACWPARRAARVDPVLRGD